MQPVLAGKLMIAFAAGPHRSGGIVGVTSHFSATSRIGATSRRSFAHNGTIDSQDGTSWSQNETS